MLRDLTARTQVYLVTGYTDLRRSIDGLAMIVKAQLQLNPYMDCQPKIAQKLFSQR